MARFQGGVKGYGENWVHRSGSLASGIKVEVNGETKKSLMIEVFYDKDTRKELFIIKQKDWTDPSAPVKENIIFAGDMSMDIGNTMVEIMQMAAAKKLADAAAQVAEAKAKPAETISAPPGGMTATLPVARVGEWRSHDYSVGQYVMVDTKFAGDGYSRGGWLGVVTLVDTDDTVKVDFGGMGNKTAAGEDIGKSVVWQLTNKIQPIMIDGQTHRP